MYDKRISTQTKSIVGFPATKRYFIGSTCCAKSYMQNSTDSMDNAICNGHDLMAHGIVHASDNSGNLAVTW